MHMWIYYFTFLHFTDITFCHTLIITCRLITNEKILNCRPTVGRRTTDIWMLSALQALSSWFHLTLTFTLEYAPQIGRQKRHLLYTLLLSFLYSVLVSLPYFSLLSLLFLSFLIVSPSACPQCLLLCPCPSLSSFCLWPLSLHPHSPLSVSFSWGKPFSSGCWPVSHPLHSPASPWVAVERHQERSTCPPLFLPPPNTNCRVGRHIVFLTSSFIGISQSQRLLCWVCVRACAYRCFTD